MGKGKGGKGKDEWKGKGGKGRYDRYDRYSKGEGRGPQGSQFASVPAPLLAVPQFADGSWGKELSGGLHAFDRGHILFSTKELYFEVLGQCSVHLAVPAPTKIDGRDRQEFASSGPVELAGRSFRNLQELRSEIVTLRRAHSNPPRRLEPEAERLMRSVFQHHPQAKEKLKDLQFIQVASNPQSEDPTDVTFFVMRNEQDGDDISYVKCLRAMVSKEGEQMLPLATLSHDHGLNLRVASGNVQIGPSSQGFGVRVDLERLALSVLLTEGLRGPWQLELGRQHSDLPHVPLRVVVEVAEGEAAVIRWAPPFDFALQAVGQQLALPALEDQWRSEELKKSLEAMMKDQNISGDLSSLSMGELQRIALQIVVKSLGASLHVTRSAGACAAQNQSLLRIAREQGMELTCQQLQDARTELQKVKEERDTAEATLNQLREEMAVLRRKVTQVEGERPAPAVAAAPRRAPQPAGAEAATAALEELRRRLQAELPDLAGSMLRNSLKLMSSELYSGPSRALWELLQNADDCSYDQEAEMQIEQIGNDLWIEYNERGFTWEDVEALCSLGSSTKGMEQTGEGVGFKSAFVLSSRPHILSNPYRFFFDETASCPLPHVTPQRLPADAALPRQPPERGTAVYLPLRKDFPELLNEIVPESLLFLRRLHHISVGHQSFSLRHDNGHSTLLVADSSGTKEHHYIIARVQELAIAFPLAGGGPTALLSVTLPIHRLEGLKTPLNAPFELTANREALRENSQRNVELRDALAELFLQAAAEHEILSSRVWQLQPDAEGGGFWAPFVQRVRAGLQEVPLIPVIPGAGQNNRWALKRCRNPSSELLRDLSLSASDLEKVGLAIPTEEFLRQLPEGSEFNLPEFDATDLLGLLQCGDISTTWRSYGNEWRQRVVGALERRLSEVDLVTLRSVALFPTGADDWSSCHEQIYWSLPEGAPEGLLKALHGSRACAADRALLTAVDGGGAAATHRDVAYAVLQRGLGLADVEDRRFSWSHLAYLGHHWQSILQCGAADEWLAKQTPEQMTELLRSGTALPSCSGRLLHCASELRCPFLLGCKSSATDRSNLLAEPPGANDIQARLRWELVFLRLGAQMAEDQKLQLPRNFFAEGVGKELRPLLEHYEQLGVLRTIRKKCCIPDRTGCICEAGQLLGPAFQPLVGPDGIVDLADDCAAEASQLGIVVTPTALLVAQMLERAAQGGPETLRRSYEFLSAEWREGRVDEETLLTLKTGMWMLNCDGELSFEQLADVTWEDVQRQISLWPKDGLHGIFRALGVSPSAGAEATELPAAPQPPAKGEKGPGERPQAKSSSQLLTWPALPQVRAMAEDEGGVVPVPAGAGNSGNPPPFREPSGAQLPLLGKLLQQIFYSTGGDGMLYGRLGKETREMLASDIHFTQNSISRRFGHGELKGRQVEDVAKALREGNMTTKDLPLVVVKFESNYYTLNNRSLYALRKASRAQKPLRAQVAAFESMCPVTAKFIQLRCSSLAGQDESLVRATNSSDEEA